MEELSRASGEEESPIDMLSSIREVPLVHAPSFWWLAALGFSDYGLFQLLCGIYTGQQS
jgi:hypothetical protein